MIFSTMYPNVINETSVNELFKSLENWITPEIKPVDGKIEIEIPGVEKKSIKIKVEQTKIIITAKNKKNQDIIKYVYGSYELENSATYEDGILTLILKTKTSNTITVS